ncbi:class I SAM-dependent methyltransferase [Hymenobacter sp. UV11]|uniref:class I SAM-dependent methyltransferase n=1 Tax=Hymenobacter sp. UV11 TaxID=1849735 RepID=UPI0010612EDF|nr:class I SAM-dependent methyltransferase [Hymenobacter sp. UV11]TDN39608.1 methyltransferase [Hymenobacter sp. UV11]TFZ63355.1 class I SAM-dependent methyltransferase [Hymenobacter sp. UV11]
MIAQLTPFLHPGVDVHEREHYVEIPIRSTTAGLLANVYYFNHSEWAEEYLTYCHRSESFRSRWQAALGDWTGKIVVDIGCGPGNIFATLQGKPELLIGIDVAPKSLELAKNLGYTTVLADATSLPFVSGFADVVMLNATLHHCEDMEAILAEAARLVKPGGLLVTDHDPQRSAWDYKGVAKLLWNGRLILYKLIGKGFHKTDSQQQWGLACEIHHKPGHGVTKDMFRQILQPLDFEVAVYPHNHDQGAAVLQGQRGKAELKYQVGNLLSGRNPNADESALTLMCVAKRR